MPGFGALGKFFGKTVSEGASFAAGAATAEALRPVLQDVINEAWRVHHSRPVDVGDAAEIVAEDVQKEPWGADQAVQQGLTEDKFLAIVGAVLNAPGFGELLTLWRRGNIDQATFEHGLRKARLETLWDGPLEALKTDRLDLAVVALAIVRGLIPDPGILPVSPPSGSGKVPAFPVFNIDALTEAASQGLDRERLSVMVGNMGRPMAVIEAAHAAFRKIIDRVDFDRAVAEGDVRNEWRDALFEVARQILTAHEYVEGELRGLLTTAERRDKTAQHGMSEPDSDLLFEITGRPLNVHAITTGLARGGEFGGTYDDVPEPYRDAIRRSAIRPEYARLAYADRYTYPSGFQIRAEAKAGALSEADTEQLLLEVGWSPKWAAFFAQAWTGATATTADKHVSSATTSLVTTIRRRYVNSEITEPQAAAALAGTTLPQATQAGLLATWTKERDVNTLAQAPPVA